MAVIDADAHVIETERTWDYLEGKDQQYRPVPVGPESESAPQRRYWVVDGQLVIRGGLGRPNPISADIREMRDLDGRLREMDALGHDIQVLYPTFFLHQFTKKPEVEVPLCRSYNRWLADIWSHDQRRFRWAVVPPLLSLPDALEEIRFGKEHGACGIFFRAVEGDRFLNDEHFYPVYALAEELDLPICVHAGNGNVDLMQIYSGDKQQAPFLSLVLPVLGAFLSVYMSEISERFPRLRFAFMEATSQWVPFLVQEAARRSQRTGRSVPASPLRDKRIYVAVRTDDDLPYVTSFVGDDNLVLGTDFGHTDFFAELDALGTLNEKQGGRLSQATIGKILDDNARALYGL